MRTISHDEERPAIESAHLDLRARRYDRSADAIRRGWRAGTVGDDGQYVHNNTGTAHCDASRAAIESAASAWREREPVAADSSDVERCAGHTAAWRIGAHLSSMVRVRTGRNDRGCRQDSPTPPAGAMATSRCAGPTKVRFRRRTKIGGHAN